jgi:hypothetical protein
MTVLEPFDAKLLPESKTRRVEQGNTVELALKLENIPASAVIDLIDLPRGVTSRSLGRSGNQERIVFEAAAEAEPGAYGISAAASVGNRRASAPIALTVYRPHSNPADCS